jgi:hypothetical protein
MSDLPESRAARTAMKVSRSVAMANPPPRKMPERCRKSVVVCSHE